MALALQILARNGGNIAGVILTRANMRRVASFGYDEAAAYNGQYRDYYRGYYNWEVRRPRQPQGSRGQWREPCVP